MTCLQQERLERTKRKLRNVSWVTKNKHSSKKRHSKKRHSKKRHSKRNYSSSSSSSFINYYSESSSISSIICIPATRESGHGVS